MNPLDDGSRAVEKISQEDVDPNTLGNPVFDPIDSINEELVPMASAKPVSSLEAVTVTAPLATPGPSLQLQPPFLGFRGYNLRSSVGGTRRAEYLLGDLRKKAQGLPRLSPKHSPVTNLQAIKERVEWLQKETTLQARSNQLKQEAQDIENRSASVKSSVHSDANFENLMMNNSNALAPGDLHSSPASHPHAGQGHHAQADPVYQAGQPSSGHGSVLAGLRGGEMELVVNLLRALGLRALGT
jgi:hypothetical protein